MKVTVGLVSPFLPSPFFSPLPLKRNTVVVDNIHTIAHADTLVTVEKHLSVVAAE